MPKIVIKLKASRRCDRCGKMILAGRFVRVLDPEVPLIICSPCTFIVENWTIPPDWKEQLLAKAKKPKAS